ncbi:Protein CBR-UNC-49 [Caenorhabditis briggsae]|uniref:Protein CBR-UNC-49 n=1 Tax=Caenorhabditis briggsae TaxID=6238 RepID=A8XSJ3_CAEBR|nr:Protein CBR-UNC-49 [Caenorhabditis briggsae]CAP35835.2 Protein CBR-UNC-49 [Caenorhabditis briggsae]
MTRPLIFVVLLTAQICLHVVLCQDEDSHINTALLSSVLDRLTNRTTYDKRLRPRYGEKPVDVGITIHVSSISAVSEVDMDFTLDFYMRQTWQDPRLAFGSLDLGLSKEIDSLTVGVDYLDKLWKPDTFFPNEKKSFFHLATTHNSFLRIDSDGTVYTSQRLTVTATCPMDLKLFPMDSQHCKLEIESYGYSILDIVYVSHEKKSVSTESYELPQFVLQSIKVVNQTQKLSSGEYSRLCWFFLFKRNIGFYIIQIYLPSVLIVVISWVSFWLSRDATPARVALGVTTVLTMTTLMTMTNSAMPKVSYVKSIDIFLGVCFMMVFCSLLEYAAVGYISKRMKLVRARKESRMLTPLPQMEAPPKRTLSVPSYFNNTTYRPFYSSTDRTSNLYIPESQRTIIFANEDAVPNELTPMLGRSNSQASVFLYQTAIITDDDFGRFWRWLRPSNIDKYSRSLFPSIFVLFNVGYWAYFIRLSQIEEQQRNSQILYGYQTKDIDYYWGKKRTDLETTAVKFDTFQLPQFQPTLYFVNTTKAETSSGKYVRLALEVILVRNMGFYTMNIVIPSILIVTISWVSFWLNREASPARVGLGVTTVLTMTTLITTTNNSMPKVSYVKGLDVFLNFCFVMVFASLLEYAIVSYMNKRLVLRREKRRKAAEQQQRNEMPMFNASPKAANNNSYEMTLMSQNSTPAKSYVQADLYFAGHNSSMNPLMEIPENCDCRTIPMMQHPRLVTDGAHTLWPAPFARPKKASKTCCQRWTPAKIDKLSRYCFPLSFSVFNECSSQTKTNVFRCIFNGRDRVQLVYFEGAELCVSGESRRKYRIVELSVYENMPETDTCQHFIGLGHTPVYGLVSYLIATAASTFFKYFFLPISFWINRDSAPSRTLIGTMTVLTETHLMTGTNRRLPPVAYVKAVDVFLGFCYLLVILALIEYACVAYSKKKNEDRRRREKKMEHKPAPPTPDILHDIRLAECTCNAAPTSIIAVIKQPNRFCVSHSHIDIVSRAAFPIVFIVFNIVFWLMLLYKSKRLPYISEHEGDRCDAPELH